MALASAFYDTCKRYLKFCTICNKKGESYYTQELYMETREEAIYSHYLIKDNNLILSRLRIKEDNVKRNLKKDYPSLFKSLF